MSKHSTFIERQAAKRAQRQRAAHWERFRATYGALGIEMVTSGLMVALVGLLLGGAALVLALAVDVVLGAILWRLWTQSRAS
jgi:hypothetical protein